MDVATLSTPGYHGYNIKFSPFFENKLGCAAAVNYGISGPGALFVLDLETGKPQLQISHKVTWPDGIFDLTWSETSPDTIVTGSGDGTLHIWLLAPGVQEPQRVLTAHSKEVSSLDWSQTRAEQLILSGSWDSTVAVWDPESGDQVCQCQLENDARVYAAVWSPHIPGCFLSVAGDGCLKIWDMRLPEKSTLSIPAHVSEILSADWCKYDSNVVATGGVEGLIRGWDLRIPHQPLFQLTGHEYSLRRVKFSPHKKSLLCSTSYDFTTRIWEWETPYPLQTLNHHTEFVYGLDFSNLVKNLVADCSWDETVRLYQLDGVCAVPDE